MAGYTTREQLYTNSTTPYFRVPHIYIALPARFMQGPSPASSAVRSWRSTTQPDRESKVEIQDASGQVVPSYALDVCDSMIGDEIEDSHLGRQQRCEPAGGQKIRLRLPCATPISTRCGFARGKGSCISGSGRVPGAQCSPAGEIRLPMWQWRRHRVS